MRLRPVTALLLLVLLLALPGCGTLEIHVETTITQVLPTQAQATSDATSPPAQPTLTATRDIQPQPAEETPQPSGPAPLRLPAGAQVSLDDFRMFDLLSGWGVGRGQANPVGHVLRSTDGGATWADVSPVPLLNQSDPQLTTPLAAFADASHAWVIYSSGTGPLAGEARTWRTGDAGQTWTASQPLDLTGIDQEVFMPFTLGFLDAQHGWLGVHLGAGMSHDYIAIFTTADGGDSWQRVADPQGDSEIMPCAKTGLVFLTPDEAWLSGDCGGVIAGVFLYNSADGGNTWKPVTLPPPADAAAIFTSEDGYCGSTLQPSSADKLALTVTCVTASSGSARSWLYVSSDRGQNWKTTPLPAPYGHLDFAGDAIWLLGQSDYSNAPDIGLYRSTNAGATWQRVLTPGWTGRPNFVDADNGWVLAEAQDVRALVRTSNGGLSWHEVNPVIGE